MYTKTRYLMQVHGQFSLPPEKELLVACGPQIYFANSVEKSLSSQQVSKHGRSVCTLLPTEIQRTPTNPFYDCTQV